MSLAITTHFRISGDGNVAALLSGIRVLDLTTVLAGPFAAYQLSLFGAEVIKLEIPGIGDLAREIGVDGKLHLPMMGASFLAQNAGKRSMTVNLKTEKGREVFKRLVRNSDVLIENMRPGVLDRLGFSWATLHEINPQLVYCAISGFGSTGPMAGRPAYDQIIQGLAGMSDVTGLPSGGPLRVGFPVCDTLGGFSAAMAVCSALVNRQTTGIGSFLDVSMLETALTAMGWVVSDQLIAGWIAERYGNDNATSAPSGTFQTGDGPLNIAANTQHQFESVCEVCGCPELLTDPRFLTRGDRKNNRHELRAELEKVLKSRGAREWETLLSSADVPAGRVLTVHEALTQEQVEVRELLHNVEVTAARTGSVTVLGSGVHVDGQALAPRLPPPLLGQHTDDILTELDYSAEEMADLRSSGAV
jgi:crotonobetainyl-CoA:carnitine CoA-transferase CaiB-like acyl-CoA transferase